MPENGGVAELYDWSLVEMASHRAQPNPFPRTSCTLHVSMQLDVHLFKSRKLVYVGPTRIFRASLERLFILPLSGLSGYTSFLLFRCLRQLQVDVRVSTAVMRMIRNEQLLNVCRISQVQYLEITVAR